jgi:hypothetical protein
MNRLLPGGCVGMSRGRGQAGRGRWALGRALTSGAPGELGGFGRVGAQWLHRVVMGPGRVVRLRRLTGRWLTARKRT